MIKWVLIFLSIVSLCSTKVKAAEYYSQFDQDKWVNENIFKNKPGGIFLDIGAHNGKSFSNTYFFEKFLNWSGICVEPMPEVFEQLRKNRRCICINGGIGEDEGVRDFLRIYGELDMYSGFIDKYDARHFNLIKRELGAGRGTSRVIQVKTYNVNKLLEAHNLFSIDFMSLDTEGGELDILKSIDFLRFRISVITVENNYKDEAISHFLTSVGYEKVAELGVDELYVFKE